MAFPIRGILKLTGDLLRRAWLPLLLVTLVYLLPSKAIWLAQKLAFNSNWRGAFVTHQGTFGPAAFAFIAITWFLRGFHMSAVTEVAVRTAASKPIRPGRLILTAAITALPILLLQTLLGLAIMVGSLFLVVPGLFLGVAFSVVVPAYICEGKSLPEAFRQSFKLTQGRRLPIGALWSSIILVGGLLNGSLLTAAAAAESIIRRTLPMVPLPSLPLPPPVSPVFTSPLGMVLTTLASQGYVVVLMVLNVGIYLALRFYKTDPAENQIAALFE